MPPPATAVAFLLALLLLAAAPSAALPRPRAPGDYTYEQPMSAVTAAASFASPLASAFVPLPAAEKPLAKRQLVDVFDLPPVSASASSSRPVPVPARAATTFLTLASPSPSPSPAFLSISPEISAIASRITGPGPEIRPSAPPSPSALPRDLREAKETSWGDVFGNAWEASVAGPLRGMVGWLGVTLAEDAPSDGGASSPPPPSSAELARRQDGRASSLPLYGDEMWGPQSHIWDTSGRDENGYMRGDPYVWRTMYPGDGDEMTDNVPKALSCFWSADFC